MIKERVRRRNYDTALKNDNKKIRINFPNEYDGVGNCDYAANDCRRVNGNARRNQVVSNYAKYNNTCSGSQIGRYENNETYYNDYSNFDIRPRSAKAEKVKKKHNPRVIAMTCVFAFLTVMVCTLIALNAVPANAVADNLNDTPIVNTERLEENIKKDTIITPPIGTENSPKNWFDALCDWLSK